MKHERELRYEFEKTGHLKHYNSLKKHKHPNLSNREIINFLYKKENIDQVPFGKWLGWENISYCLNRITCEKKREFAWRVILQLEREGMIRMFENDDFEDGIFHVFCHPDRIVRPPETWKRKGRNFHKEFFSLVRHLFTRFPTPKFLEKVWIEDCEADILFFLDLANGKSVYRHERLKDFVINRKTTHFIRQAPSHYSLKKSVRWAQLKALNMPKPLIRPVLNSFLGEQFSKDYFWIGIMKWLSRQNEAGGQEARDILDYINYVKFGVFPIGKSFMSFPASEPDFQIKGRTWVSMLRKTEEWLADKQMISGQAWQTAPISGKKWELREDCYLELSQLTSSKDLVEEGRAMNHCVATYLGDCLDGSLSIWVLRKYQKGKMSRLLTLDLSHSTREVEQARKRFNQDPSPEEIKLIEEWALENKFTIDEDAFC